MNVHVPQPYPSPLPDWMAQCNLDFFSGGSPYPIQSAYCAPGGSSSELRYQWYTTQTEGVIEHAYSPSGKTTSQWMSSNPRVSFSGAYENKKVVSISEGPAVMADIWVRFWDENGFVYDSKVLPVGSV
jgi:hypothetical protein